MPRLFVAAWPPDEVLDALAALHRPAVPGLRWTARDQWHVTLRFLGPVADVGAVAEALDGLEAGVAPAVVGPAVGRFGRRVLHVPVAGLDTLAGAVGAVTASMGRPVDDRPFAGHLTLARVGRAGGVDLRVLVGAGVRGWWAVDEVCLVESRPSGAGSRYRVLSRYALRRA